MDQLFGRSRLLGKVQGTTKFKIKFNIYFSIIHIKNVRRCVLNVRNPEVASQLYQQNGMYKYLCIQPIFFLGGQLAVRSSSLAVRTQRICESYLSSASEFGDQIVSCGVQTAVDPETWWSNWLPWRSDRKGSRELAVRPPPLDMQDFDVVQKSNIIRFYFLFHYKMVAICDMLDHISDL